MKGNALIIAESMPLRASLERTLTGLNNLMIKNLALVNSLAEDAIH